MIALDFIVKLYNSTYKELSKKLGISTSTVNDWLSKRRPIPQAKLETLSSLFKLESSYFSNELTKIEEIEIELDYLRRRSKRDSVQIEDIVTDEFEEEHEGLKCIDPHADERIWLQQELSWASCPSRFLFWWGYPSSKRLE